MITDRAAVPLPASIDGGGPERDGRRGDLSVAADGRRRWRLGAVEDVPLNEGRRVVVDGEEIALFRCEDRFRAVSGRCPHAGGPLADGIVAGSTVTCPLHSRIVNLESGLVDDCADRVRVYRVVEDGGAVYLEDEPGEE